MPKSRSSKPSFSKRKVATEREQQLGIHGLTTAQARDFFSNIASRTGLGGGSSSLENFADYQVERFTLNYWSLIALAEVSWVARRIVEAPAEDIMKCFPTIQGEITPEDIAAISKAIRKTGTRDRMLTALKWARLFGGAGLLIVIKGQEHDLEQPLKLDDIELNSYKGVIEFERWSGITPLGDVCTDIESKDFGLPEHYEVRVKNGDSFRVHCSRIIRFTGPKMPEPENSAYSGWGLSVLAPIYQSLVSYDTVSANALSLTFRANVLGMRVPDLAQLLSGLGSSAQASQKFEARMQQMNHMLSNQSLVLLPQDGELSQVQYSFSGLDSLVQTYQLQVAGAAKMPVTRLWGRTNAGLGQAGDGDERIYEETIATEANTTLRPALDKLLSVIAMSEIGEVPDDMDLVFPSLRVLDEKERAELAKATADTVVVYMNAGLMSPRCAAKEIKQASVITGIGTNLTDEAIEKLSDDVTAEGELGEGLFGAGSGGLEPASSPAKVVKEENHVEKEEGQKPELKAKPEKAVAKDEDGPAVEAINFQGLPIVIETRRGEVRRGEGWATVMPYDYGYLKGVGPCADGDSLDVAVGPDRSSSWVYIVDQGKLNDPRVFDESKVFLGFPSANAALKAFHQGHHRSADVLLDWTPMPINEFKGWVKRADLRRPCSREALK